MKRVNIATHEDLAKIANNVEDINNNALNSIYEAYKHKKAEAMLIRLASKSRADVPLLIKVKKDKWVNVLNELITYYNAKCLYENNLKGFKIYLEQKKSLHLLKEQPGIIKDIVKSSTTNRGYGIHMSEPIKRQAEIYLRDWLLTKKADTEGENTKYNLHSIYSIPLLQELIAYTVKGNYDRVIAFMLCILHEHENFNITVKKEVTHRKFAGTILDRNLFQNKKSSRLNSFR
jgi:hypothetical protein